MDSGRLRPARYKQVGQPASRVPPRYRRSADGDDGPPPDVLSIGAVLNVLAVFGVSTLLFLAVGRFLFEDSRDPYKCAAITNEGRWLESSDLKMPPLEHWQPRGCAMHTYTARDIVSCLPDRRILFVGDQSIKSIYFATLDKLSNRTMDHSKTPWERDERITSLGKTTGKDKPMPNLTVEFLWDPYLNSTRLEEELKPWKNGTVDPEYTKNGEYDPPALFIVGAGIWWAQNKISPNPHSDWREAIDRVAGRMRWGPRPTFLGGRDMLLLTPVAHPAWEKLAPAVRGMMNPILAIDMNRYIQQLATIQGLDIVRAWRVAPEDTVDLVVSNHVYNHYVSKGTEDDGIVILRDVARARVDMVLNLRCNDFLRGKGEGVMNSDCCVKHRKPGWVQMLVLLCAVAVLPALRIWRWNNYGSFLDRVGLEPVVLKRIWHLCLALMLCFYADRTPVFNKTQKFWAPSSFWNSIFGVFVASIVLVQRPAETATAKDIESRVFDEWKGVGVAIHLISLYFGGSTVFSTFTLVFVNTVQWSAELLRDARGKRGIYYFAKTLMSINIIVVPVAFMTRSQYILYEIPALYTFWFLVVYATLQVMPRRNWVATYFFLKLTASLMVVGGVLLNDRVSGAFFGTLRMVEIQWDRTAVRILLLPYCYAVYVGMVVGWVYVRVFLVAKEDMLKKFTLAANVIAGWLGLSYAIIKMFGRLDEAWEQRHIIYTIFARIAQFGLLRLSTSFMRRRQSVFLVWLGSLEGAVWAMVNHAWLAGNGSTLLDLGIWSFDDTGILANYAVWTAVFMYFCWGVRDAAEEMVGWIIVEEAVGKEDDKKNDTEVEMIDVTDADEENGHYGNGTGGVIWQRAKSKGNGKGIGLTARLGIVFCSVVLLHLIS
ncbi:hypothetical protein H072_4851 [Dactylellina haptotyla CBS 200.50]|uniref:Cas1p 10 TM acyl transferase domain-containing protein n=1 Tax=Dactylellina haptotyla (strain CBS 200.50) TaxID=1284197 RepID=S8AEK6_DACHA|nr:hypothetical protein H072_4851 [Dactylellina haptotyla CBS 200.50]